MQSYAMFFAWKTTMVKKSILLKVSLKGNTIAMRIPAVCVFIIYHYVINDPKTQRKTIHLYLFHNICGQEPGHSLGGPSFSGSLTGLHKSFGEAAGCAFLSGCQTWGLISHLLAKKTSPADSPAWQSASSEPAHEKRVCEMEVTVLQGLISKLATPSCPYSVHKTQVTRSRPHPQQVSTGRHMYL